MIGEADGIETKLLDLAAAAQKFRPRDVGQHEHGKPQLTGHRFISF
jgi:hypothetical protein